MVSAYAFAPGHCSEPAVGWNIVNELAKLHDVWVVTNYIGKESIDKHLKNNSHIQVQYFDMPGPLSRTGLLGKSAQMHYYLWQLAAIKTMKQMHKSVQFDVCHHLTYVKYWAPAGIAWVDAPLVWGPIGGGDGMPHQFLVKAPNRAKIFECIREAMRKLSHIDPFVRKAANKASHAITVTPETHKAVRSLNSELEISIMTQVGISHSELDEIDQISDVTQEEGDLNPCIFLCVGNLIYLKAVHLAIQALGHAKLQNARLWIAGSGQEDKRLKILTKKLKLSDQVEFLGQVNRCKVMQLMQDSTCLVHASLHDSGGFVVVEAMANSRPVICLKLAGPDVIVAENAGLKVEANDESATVMALAQAMIQIASNPAAAITMGKHGRRHVENNLLWRNKADKINSIYRSLTFESETEI